MSKHTPGPWISKDFRNLPRVSRVSNARESVADVYASENAAANARLIAAAPDLLDALTALTRRVQLANAEGDPIASALIPDCLAAIAKATGEQP